MRARRLSQVRPAGRVAVVGAALALLAACSNSEPAVQKNPHTGSATASEVAGGVQQVTLTSGADLRFHPSTFTVHPGMVQVVLDNTGSSSGGPPHNLLVTGFPGDYIPFVSAGDRGSVTFRAPSPGRYKFVCTIHEAQGQVGTMIVVPGS